MTPAPNPVTPNSVPAAVNSALAAAMRSADSICIKCGFCLPVCPTYRETGNEAASPRGRLDLMYAAAQGRLTPEQIEAPLGLCLGCLACQTACPAGIRFGDMLEAEREDVARRNRRAGILSGVLSGALKHLLLNGLLLSPFLRRVTAWKLFFYQRSGLQALLRFSHLLWLVPPLARQEWALPPLPAPWGWRRRARAQTVTSLEQAGQRKAALLFTGCVMDTVFGAVHGATARVLGHNGYAALLPPGQGCCGALHLHEGELEKARTLARANIAVFEQSGESPIVVNSAGCGAMLKDYGRLLAGDGDWAERARRIAQRVRDVSEFLADLSLRPPTRETPLTVAYDDACHLLHAQGIGDAPRRLLAAIPGLRVVPLPEADWCCGSAGSYSIHQPAMSAQVLRRKMARILETEVAVVATANPGCLLQLRLGAKRHGLKLRVMHPVELLAKAYE